MQLLTSDVTSSSVAINAPTLLSLLLPVLQLFLPFYMPLESLYFLPHCILSCSLRMRHLLDLLCIRCPPEQAQSALFSLGVCSLLCSKLSFELLSLTAGCRVANRCSSRCSFCGSSARRVLFNSVKRRTISVFFLLSVALHSCSSLAVSDSLLFNWPPPPGAVRATARSPQGTQTFPSRPFGATHRAPRAAPLSVVISVRPCREPRYRSICDRCLGLKRTLQPRTFVRGPSGYGMLFL